MYRAIGQSDECTIPEVCREAVREAPGYLNTSLVDKYCEWSEDHRFEIDDICAAALSKSKEDRIGTPEYPWGTLSEWTRDGQRYANVLLQRHGYRKVAAHGSLNRETCGAWAELCDIAQQDDPLGIRPSFLANRQTGDVIPCFATDCRGRDDLRPEKSVTSAAAGVSPVWIGGALLAGVAAVIYFGGRRKA